jgi:hypothetical protein
VVIERVFEADGAGGARFHEARGVGAETIAEIQAPVRRRLLRAAARRGLIEREDAQAMGAWEHTGGFALDASVCVEAHDRLGLERSPARRLRRRARGCRRGPAMLRRPRL